MQYVRLAEGLKKYKLIPANENIFSHIKDHNKDYYVSIFQYNEDQYNQWKNTKSVAGIKEVVTNKLIFDFDNAKNLDAAKADALTLTSRLLTQGIKPDELLVSFSGSKGFCIEVKSTSIFSQEEFKNITVSLAGDLETFDKVVNDAQRVIRVIGTKHQTSGLYKSPLSLDEISNLTIEQIKEKCSKFENINEDLINNFKESNLPPTITSLRFSKKEEKKLVDITELNLRFKPKWLTEVKYALQQGFFGNGERNHAFMILASTYKAQGFNMEITYRMLKGVAEIQAQRNDVDRYSDKELYNNIVKVVYGDTWNGGQYSTETDPLLKSIAERLGLKRDNILDAGLVGVQDFTSVFRKFATNIDQNTIKLGVKEVDDSVRVTTSMVVGLLAGPSSGKCLGKGTKVRMFDGSLKNVEDIKPNDLLMGDDSAPRKVLSITSGREEMFEVVQENGNTYTVNRSHILSVKSGSEQYELGKVYDMNVVDYMNQSTKFKKRVRGYKVGVEYEAKTLDIDPYLLGYWLGDGTASKPSITIGKHDEGILNPLQKILGDQYKIKVYDRDTSLELSITMDGAGVSFGKLLERCNVLNNKHIPKDYLINSRSNRLKLLAGLIDSDGYSDGASFEITFKDKVLSDNTLDLIRSLGIKATQTKMLKKYKSFSKGKWYEGESEVYRIYANGNLSDVPVLHERKKAKDCESRNVNLTTLDIKSIGGGEYYGFEIDGNRRFLLEDYTVTHNTSVSLGVLNHNSLAGAKPIFFSLDMGAPLVYQRLLQRHTGLSGDKILKMYKDGDAKVKELEDTVTKNYSNVHFCFKTGIGAEDIRSNILDLENKTGERSKLIVIDYLECIVGPYSDPTANSALIANQLKDIANELDVCIILLLQPQKQAGDPSEALLSMRNVKGSSVIEQACSVIFTMWRPGFSPETPEDDTYLSMAVVKNRMGPLAIFDFNWEGLTGKIESMDYLEREELKQLKKRVEARKKEKDLI